MKFRQNLTLHLFKVNQGHRSWCQSKAHVRLPITVLTFLTTSTMRRLSGDFVDDKLKLLLRPIGPLHRYSLI